MSPVHPPFEALTQLVLNQLASNTSVAITGLSNTGKSIFMRGLASPDVRKQFRKISGKDAILIYIDCNRAVASSARAFYEIVLRSLLENANKNIDEQLANSIRDHHQAVTEAVSSFSASLSFNLALTELCERADSKLCLILDEFDEIYASLDDRGLLNLRALRDRFIDRLTFVTATIRKLPAIRGTVTEGEFAELFSHSTFVMPAFENAESEKIISDLALPHMNQERIEASMGLSGNHPGMLISIAQVLGRLPEDWEGDFLKAILREPQPRAECLKIWEQLTHVEQTALISLTLDSAEGLGPQERSGLEELHLIDSKKIFSPIFAKFVARRGRGTEVQNQGVFVDVDSGDVWVSGVRIPVLTDLEFRLLSLLYERRDKITDKYRIVTAVWGESYLGEVDDARVEKLVSRLRGKIEPDPSNPHYLITQRGRGYKLLSIPRKI
jgi:DNA-binding winged helix-turn-helix (wHTH) protein/KaiC/GvpD/RAD55 family RecA-like ATPase